MPRIQVDLSERDTNFAIEEAIAQTLRDHNIARISSKSVEMEYDVLNDDLEPLTCSLEEKCTYLAKKFDASFEFKDGDVWLRKRRSRQFRSDNSTTQQ